MKHRILSLLLALCLAVALMPLPAAEASSAAEYEQAWYPATRMYVVQIAYESASHKDYNTIDIANTTDLSAADKRIFAPFTGIIVYRDKGYGYVLLQSTDKVRYADGTLDYMTVGFMHDNDISDLPLGKVIKQGTAFYDAGSMGSYSKGVIYGKDNHVQISVFKGRFFNVTGPNSNGTYTIGKQIRSFYKGKLSPGDVYAFDAFSVNTSVTKANKYTKFGQLASGNTVSKKGAPTDWSGLWKDLNGDRFCGLSVSGHNAPSSLKVGESFSTKGEISSKTKITSVTAGIFTSASGGTMKFGGTVQPNASTYKLTKLTSFVQFNKLPAGTYWYRVTATNSAGTETLINARFTVGTPASATSPSTTTTPPAAAPKTVNPAQGWYTLAPACAPGLRLDVAYSGTSSGDEVWTWEANGTPAQLWYVASYHNGYYTFIAGVDPDSRMVLDVQYGGTTSGTPVWQYEYNGSEAQQWLFLDAGGGYYYIVPRENQKLALAVKGGSSAECSSIVIETRNGSSGQKWKLIKY